MGLINVHFWFVWCWWGVFSPSRRSSHCSGSHDLTCLWTCGHQMKRITVNASLSPKRCGARFQITFCKSEQWRADVAVLLCAIWIFLSRLSAALTQMTARSSRCERGESIIIEAGTETEHFLEVAMLPIKEVIKAIILYNTRLIWS